MKQLDKLILKSFIPPFFLSLIVVVFILLNRQLLLYYDDIIGKGIDFLTIMRFLGYLVFFMLPHAMPLAVLLAGLISFGNLAEHEELSAFKAAGISPLRVLMPVFFFVVIPTIGAFIINDRVVPSMALRTYTLLYDIKQKKPTMELKEGVFYNGLPDVSMKVGKKFNADDAALKDVMLYDHRGAGGREVWVADSGRMYTIHKDQLMKFELYNGFRYDETSSPHVGQVAREHMTRTAFAKTELIFDLSSFVMGSTNPLLFAGHKNTKSRRELLIAIDSISTENKHERLALQQWLRDEHARNDETPIEKARSIRTKLLEYDETTKALQVETAVMQIQRQRILTNSIACLAMFLIGAPLGIIIRKGGLGKPALLAIVFFLLFFVLDIQAEKVSKQLFIQPEVAMWLPNAMLFLVGGYFLKTASTDSELPSIRRWFHRLKVSRTCY